MKIDILTLFPEMFAPVLSTSILGRAIRAGRLNVQVSNIRDWTTHRQRCTDDYPFGGGAGMVMMAQPIVDAVEAVDPRHEARRIYLSPRGRTFTQALAEELSGEERLLLLCGHYEGVDERALEMCVDEELSIGDYVLTGGELGALVVVDAVSRLLPGVLGSDESSVDESFSTGLLEYPQYTRPAEFRGRRVPEVLLGGNHADIEAWRREQALRVTKARRPDLLASARLSEPDRAMLARLEAEESAVEQLRAMGQRAQGAPLSEADAFAKRWLEAFVPQDRRKAAKKQCVSGRRHVGWLYQAFAMGFIPAAQSVERAPGDVRWARAYLQDEGVLLTLPEGADAETIARAFRNAALTDAAFARTLVHGGGGLWYAERV